MNPRRFLFHLAILPCLAITASAADISESLTHLRNVGPEGKGNVEAAAAWGAITGSGAEAILPTLEAMEGASPLARNWMRTAVETVFEKELSAGSSLPTKEMRDFVLERDNDPNARHLAFDLFARVEPDSAEKMVPEMLDDPSTALRRTAVARLIEEGGEQLSGGDKDAAAATFSRALDAARDVDQIEAIAKRLRNDLGKSVDLPKHFGFLMYWDVIAPFDNTGREGFETVFPPEKGIDLDATYEGKEGKKVAWQDYATSDDYGKVDFNQPFGPLKEVVGYAYTEFESAEERPAELRLGCKNAWKIWFNGELVFARDEYHRGQRIDQYILPVRLDKGANTILVKACQNEQEETWTAEWEFKLRVCDSTGTAILSTDRKPTPQPEAKPRRRAGQ